VDDQKAGQQWHWGEGTKFAIEGIKTLLLLNGGSAVALLAFLGSKTKPDAASIAIAKSFGFALVCFGAGALLAAFVFMSAYLTQLEYGNGTWSKATRWHTCTYVMFSLSAISFVAGLWFSWSAIIAN
jgi:hypothetical protein